MGNGVVMDGVKVFPVAGAAFPCGRRSCDPQIRAEDGRPEDGRPDPRGLTLGARVAPTGSAVSVLPPRNDLVPLPWFNFVTRRYERTGGIVKTLKTRYVALATAVVAGAIGLAACGGGSGEVAQTSNTPIPAEPDSGIGDTPIPVEPDGGTGASGGTMLAGDVLEATDFVGMTLDVAGSWAEENGRQWRVGSQDGEESRAYRGLRARPRHVRGRGRGRHRRHDRGGAGGAARRQVRFCVRAGRA